MKVNLEKELIRQNRRIAAPKELLLINEYDRLGSEVANDSVLHKIGINAASIAGKELKEKIAGLKGQSEKFNPVRVFHISQIEALCKKYYLKFLPSHLYKGSIDPLLPAKISQFEIAYSADCNKSNCFIAAPRSSFNLEEKPKDPLLFYKINEEYYYLIHKWGNDLSITRRLLPLFATTWFTVLALLSFSICLALFIRSFLTDGIDKTIAIGIPIIVALVMCVPILIEGGSFISKNKWNSKFTD